jgi:hypothetical protein
VCVLTARHAGMSSVAASLEVDQAQINRLLLDLVAIGERHGIRFPREWWGTLRHAVCCGVLGWGFACGGSQDVASI